MGTFWGNVILAAILFSLVMLGILGMLGMFGILSMFGMMQNPEYWGYHLF